MILAFANFGPAGFSGGAFYPFAGMGASVDFGVFALGIGGCGKKNLCKMAKMGKPRGKP